MAVATTKENGIRKTARRITKGHAALCSVLERFRATRPVRRFCAFCYSPLFVYATGSIALLLNMLGWDAVTYTYLALTASVVLLACPDALPVLALTVFFTVSRSMKGRVSYWDHGYAHFPAAAWAVVWTSAGIAAVCALWHVAAGFSVRPLLGSRLLVGYLFLSAGLICNGFFRADYPWNNLVRGFGLTACFFGIFIGMRTCIRPTRETLRYFAYICVVQGLSVCVQLCGAYLFNKEFINSGYDKGSLYLGWGISNHIAETILRCIPFCFYLVCTEEKHNWYYFTVAVLLAAAIVFTYSRASLLVSLPTVAASYALCCVFGRNRKQTVLCGLIFLAAIAIGIPCLRGHLSPVLRFFKDNGFADRGRFALWDEAVDWFKRYPVFGAGVRCHYDLTGKGFVYFHNTIFQFMAMGGIVGIGTYLFHRMQTLALFTQKPTADRMFLAVSVASTLVLSLLDYFVMSAPTQIFLCFAFSLAEWDLDKTLRFAYRRRKRGRRLTGRV